MKDAPVSLTLSLWSLGHSATDIVRKLGFPNRRYVEKIVDAARFAGDERAVYHMTGNFIRGTGIPKRFRRRRPRQTHYKGFLLIEVIGKTVCVHGHMRAPNSVNARKECLQCKRARDRQR